MRANLQPILRVLLALAAPAVLACHRSDLSSANTIEITNLGLAASYAEVGDFEKATRWQIRAIELSPNNRKDDGRAKLERYKSRSPFRERRSGKTNPARDS